MNRPLANIRAGDNKLSIGISYTEKCPSYLGNDAEVLASEDTRSKGILEFESCICNTKSMDMFIAPQCVHDTIQRSCFVLC